ncbi:hypothetical protein BHM03_00019821 [Ensete ventricosum]|nr:hypothetical protein BHM03_00019821 [Ensete ventricosum]
MAAAVQANLSRAFETLILGSRRPVHPRRWARIRCSAAASPRRSYSITLLPGDGIGPEVVSVAKDVLSLVPVGGAALDSMGVPLPDETLAAAKESDAVLLGAIGGYKWDANEKHLKPETGLLQLRAGLGVFANLRPATVLPQVPIVFFSLASRLINFEERGGRGRRHNGCERAYWR